MFDWFYENMGSNASITIYLIMFIIQAVTFDFGERKLKSLHGLYRLLVTVGLLIVGFVGMFVYVNEQSFKYDYARRQFGDEFVRSATNVEINNRMDKLRDEKHVSKTDSDRELYNSLFNWAESTNLNITTVEDEYHKSGTILEINRDLEFETRRKGSDNK